MNEMNRLRSIMLGLSTPGVRLFFISSLHDFI